MLHAKFQNSLTCRKALKTGLQQPAEGTSTSSDLVQKYRPQWGLGNTTSSRIRTYTKSMLMHYCKTGHYLQLASNTYGSQGWLWNRLQDVLVKSPCQRYRGSLWLHECIPAKDCWLQRQTGTQILPQCSRHTATDLLIKLHWKYHFLGVGFSKKLPQMHISFRRKT